MARTRKRKAQSAKSSRKTRQTREAEATKRSAEASDEERSPEGALSEDAAASSEDAAPAQSEAPFGDDFLSDCFDLPECDELTREERIEKAERSKARRRRKKIVRRIVWACIALFLLGVVAACASFAWYRWYVYDDAADIQGTWRVVGTEKRIEITEDTIVLTDDVAYRYTIDPEAKTITFKFGNMTGKARYRFSLDRQLLSITDGEYDMWATLSDDVPWTLAAWVKQMLSNGAQLSPGQGVLVTELTRQLDAGADGADGADGDQSLDAGASADADEGAPAAGDGAGVPDGGTQAASDDADSQAAASDGDDGGASSDASSAVRDVDALDISDVAAHG